jgi:hypothetical protein
MRRVPEEPVPDDASGLRAANARLREQLAERDAEIAGLRADRELIQRLGLRLAELERRLDMEGRGPGERAAREGRIRRGDARRAGRGGRAGRG